MDHSAGRVDASSHLSRRLVAEGIGTAFLVIAVIGSGIMASRLTDDTAIQLLANAAATAGALIALIWMFGPCPVPTSTRSSPWSIGCSGTITTGDALAYVGAQVVGGCIGAMIANVMFELPVIEVSATIRSSGALWLSEVVATIGLLLVIHGCVRTGHGDVVAVAVGVWIGGAYWFTSSTSFANPAVTIARTLSDSFAGIAPSSAPMFIAMQLIGAARRPSSSIRFLYSSQRRPPRSDHHARPRAPSPSTSSTPCAPPPPAARRVRRRVLHRDHRTVPANQLRPIRRTSDSVPTSCR